MNIPKMKKVANQMIWSREEFLSARDAQIEAAKECPPDPTENRVGFTLSPGLEIICDLCNCEILANEVHIVSYCRMVVCEDCYKTNYAKDLERFREVFSDGCLGGFVE